MKTEKERKIKKDCESERVRERGGEGRGWRGRRREKRKGKEDAKNLNYKSYKHKRFIEAK